MKPKKPTPQCELFGAHLSELLNPEHPLYILSDRIDWRQFDLAIDACYADELGRPGVNTRLSRNHLTGTVGDQINTILAAAGYNLRKLLRWIVFSPVLGLLDRLESLLNFKSTLQRRLLSP